MPDSVSADQTAEWLLWYAQEPARYHAEGRRRSAPLLDPDVVLRLALGRHVEFASPALNETQAATLQQAAAAYVRHIFFRPDATPYQILGLAPGASPLAIKESFRLLMQLVHPDRQEGRAVWSDSFAAQANRAYAILRNQDSRARFDREAESRAAMARAMHRAAAASEASRMPVPLRPKKRGGRSSPRATLPEWLTSGVGGYVRGHPATTAFVVLIVGAGVSVGAMVSEGKEGWLTRELQESRATAASAVVAADERSADASARPADRAARAASVSEAPAPSRVALMPQRSEVADSVASSAVAAASALHTDPLPVSRAPDPPVRRAPDAPVSRAPDAPVVAAEARPPTRAAPALALVAVAGPEAVRTPVANVVVESTSPANRAAAPPTVANVERGSRAEPPVATVASTPMREAPPVANAPPLPSAPVTAAVPRAEQVAMASAPITTVLPPATAEIEALFATFVEAYERGRADTFAALFGEDADADHRHGRAAIRGEYGELFRQSEWRKMQLTRVNWRQVGDRAFAKGEITVRIGWRDGREVEQRVALDMEIVRLDGRVVIARLSQQPKN